MGSCSLWKAGVLGLTLALAGGFSVSAQTLRVTDARPPELAEFRESLRQILPGEPIEVRSTGGGLILSGQVSSSLKVDRALALAELYAPGRVSNLMTLGDARAVVLDLRFVEMQHSVARNLSDPEQPDGLLAGPLDLVPLMEALESKGAMRTLARARVAVAPGLIPAGLSQGESFALTGLLPERFRSFGRQAPWAGELPVLGRLLASPDYQRAESELVVIVTPRAARSVPVARVSGQGISLFGKALDQAPGADALAQQEFDAGLGPLLK